MSPGAFAGDPRKSGGDARCQQSLVVWDGGMEMNGAE